MKIAALLDATGAAADLSEGGSIYVFERDKEEWLSKIKLDCQPAKFDSLEELRKHIGDISRRLIESADCKVLAAKTTIGFYRLAFESFGVFLWAFEGVPQSFIGAIEAFYANPASLAARKQPQVVAASCVKPAAAGNRSKVLITPVEGEAGHYTVDLSEVVARRAGINSRDLLLPFFQNTAFSRLELTCDHMPKWFDQELPALNLRADSEFVGEAVKIIVRPR